MSATMATPGENTCLYFKIGQLLRLKRPVIAKPIAKFADPTERDIE